MSGLVCLTDRGNCLIDVTLIPAAWLRLHRFMEQLNVEDFQCRESRHNGDAQQK